MLIATEEAFAPPEYITEFLALVERQDTPVTRYLKIYYTRAESVRQLTDLDFRLAEMDRFDVSMHVLSVAAPGPQAFDAPTGSSIATLANDMLVEAIQRHPTRFAGLGAVAPQDPVRAVREVERIMGSLGLSGVIINSHTHGEYLDQEKFRPLLDACEALSAPIYLHPTFPSEVMIAPYVDYGMMGALWGFGADASLHVVRMILGGVFDRNPDLQVVLGHLGEGLPFWLDRLDNRYANILRRGGSELLGSLPLEMLPSEYFRRNFHVTTSGMNTRPALDFTLDRLGSDRVMFAIDYPYEQTQQAVEFIRSVTLPEDEMSAITQDNARRLFRLLI